MTKENLVKQLEEAKSLSSQVDIDKVVELIKQIETPTRFTQELADEICGQIERCLDHNCDDLVDKDNATFSIGYGNVIEIDEEYENLKPGWMIIKKDLLTRQTKIKMKPYLSSFNVKPEKSQQEISLDVLNALCELHEKRTTKYIELYGYDNWEKMFIYKNYDYQWVDKLDEQYEREIEEEIMTEMSFIENDYENNH